MQKIEEKQYLEFRNGNISRIAKNKKMKISKVRRIVLLIEFHLRRKLTQKHFDFIEALLTKEIKQKRALFIVKYMLGVMQQTSN